VAGAGRAASAAAGRPSHYTGMVQAVKTIVKEETLAGLWRGTVPGQLLTVPYCAVQFVALQKCKEVTERMGWDKGRGASSASFVAGPSPPPAAPPSQP